ncbi:MAG: PH domain-containing protein [Gammaproteobacteria bacterium]|nr:PH domain-containing protein [Gammaproteobacteria bacterium]
MSEVLYEEHPSLIRTHPLGTVIAILLIPVGIGILILLYWYLTMKADKLIIKEDEVIWTHGLLSKKYVEINMSSIRTTKVEQSLLQRMLNAGKLEIFTAGDEPELTVNGMPNPDKIRELIKGVANNKD